MSKVNNKIVIDRVTSCGAIGVALSFFGFGTALVGSARFCEPAVLTGIAMCVGGFALVTGAMAYISCKQKER